MKDSSGPRGRRCALVTGGAVRVGRSIAEALAAAGYDVAIHYNTSGAAAVRLAETLEEGGARAVAVQGDLSDVHVIAPVVEEAAARLGGLDLLVNSAAIFPRSDPDAVAPDAWDGVFAVNARAPFFCSQAAARVMGERGGSIVSIADIAAFEAWPAYVAYASTKAALVSITRSLARAWAPRIRVNAVAPGPVLLPPGKDSGGERDAAARRTALGRVGTPEDVAQAVLYLDRATYVTGEVIRVDGGQHLK